MRTPSDEETVVVSRRFEYDDGDVWLFIHKPHPDPKPSVDAHPDDPPWRCFYTIRCSDNIVQQRRVLGIDGMQAMLLAISLAERELRDGIGDPRRPIKFLGEDSLNLQIPQYD